MFPVLRRVQQVAKPSAVVRYASQKKPNQHKTGETRLFKNITPYRLQYGWPLRGPDPQRFHLMPDNRYIYEELEVEPDNRTVEVILIDTIEDVGVQGEVLKLDPHTARQMVLLPKRGHYATKENIEKYRGMEVDKSKLISSKHAKKTYDYLRSVLLTVGMNVREPWQLEPWHVAVAFRRASILVPVTAIRLPDEPIYGPNLDLQAKFFYVTVTINGREQVSVRCSLHHVSGNPRYRLQMTNEEANIKTDRPQAILESQQAYLDHLHETHPIDTKPPAGPQLSPEQFQNSCQQ